MKRAVLSSVAILAVTAFATPALAAGDATAGEAIFKSKCSVCHSPEAGTNKVGPSLHGVVGRHSGSIEDYNYSPAMKGFDKVWTEDQLNIYLTNPRGVVVGTKMVFPGLKDDTDRANLIAYLATLK